MKNIFFILIIMTTLISSCATAQIILKEDVIQRKSKLNEWKKSDLAELKVKIDEYFKLSVEDKKSRGVYFLERWNYSYHYYPYLKVYSDTLAPELFKYFDRNNSTRKALGLLKLPQFMKDSLVVYENTEDYVKAALGDSVSENKIVNKFKELNSKNFENKKQKDLFYDSAFALLYINSKNTIEVFLKGMESDKVNVDLESNLSEDLKLHESRFTSLLGIYSSIYKYEYIPSSWYSDRFNGLKISTKEMKLYFGEIENYFLNKYNVKIKINAPFIKYGEEEIIEDQLVEDPNKY